MNKGYKVFSFKLHHWKVFIYKLKAKKYIKEKKSVCRFRLQ